MASYNELLDSQVDLGSPLNEDLIRGLRDNPLAISEGDASIPEELRGTGLIADLSPTSGTSISTGTLDLTGYRKLFITFDAVGVTDGGGAETLSIAGVQVWAEDINAPGSVTGIIEISLLSGVGFAVMQRSGAAAQVRAIKPSITTATTSIAFTAGGGFNFSTGRIRVQAER